MTASAARGGAACAGRAVACLLGESISRMQRLLSTSTTRAEWRMPVGTTFDSAGILLLAHSAVNLLCAFRVQLAFIAHCQVIGHQRCGASSACGLFGGNSCRRSALVPGRLGHRLTVFVGATRRAALSEGIPRRARLPVGASGPGRHATTLAAPAEPPDWPAGHSSPPFVEKHTTAACILTK
jgi:hypothetical protein